MRYWLAWLLLLGILGTLPAQAAGTPLPAAPIKIVVELEDEPAVVVYHAAQQQQRPTVLAAQMSRAQIARIDES